MKIDFNTYNNPIQYTNSYSSSSFKARPIKVDWNSETGKMIEATLAWLSAYYVAQISYAKAHPDEVSDEVMAEINSVKYADIKWDENELVEGFKTDLEDSYKATNDPQIMDKHIQLCRDAFNNRDLLRGSYTEMSNHELTEAMMDQSTVSALGLLGSGVLKSAFSLDLGGFVKFCKDITSLITLLTKPNLEALKKKINPQNSLEYRNLEDDVKKDKKQITKLLGKENNLKRKELLAQVEVLKGDKENAKQVKEFKRQIQDLYKNCENSSLISDLMKKISEKQHSMKGILNGKINLSPQEIINKIWTIAALSQSPHYKKNAIVIPAEYCCDEVRDKLYALASSSNGDLLNIEKEKLETIFGDDLDSIFIKNIRLFNKDAKELIDLIQPSSEENDKAWKNLINKKIYERARLKFNKNVAEILDLPNCKYLNELIISDDYFWDIMSPMLEGLAGSLLDDKIHNIGEALDSFIPNIETKKIFKKRKIDYDAWVNYNEKSYIQDTVTITAKDAQEKAVKNMIFDLATLYSSIPKEESDKIFDMLKELGLCVKLLDNQRLEIGIDGRGIVFDDLETIMAVIKESINYNLFWSQENEDEEIEKAREYLYSHFMLQRKQEIDCAKRLKERENVDIKVRKVNMADIKYSLCLGNHSHCCTALGSQVNEWSAPAYILYRCISAIEVLANDEPVGNTMMYLADVNGELSLVLDDIELQTKFQNNDKIRDMIIQYAKQICNEIGKPDIPIYAGPGMHKVDMSDYKLVEDADMAILGKTLETSGVYLDFDADEHFIGDVIKLENGKKAHAIENTNLYRIA